MTRPPYELPSEWARVAFSSDPNPSFADLVRRIDPALLPAVPATIPQMPHGTTVLAIRFEGGVLMAGDRQATEGYHVADRRIEKVFPADEYSAVAIAGAAGPAIEIVKLLQLEIQHYEKLEGEPLSLEGKANRLGGLIRQNFPFALQGLVVVPLFAGFDVRRDEGRIFRYDAVGGRYEDMEFASTGSGSLFARDSLKKLWKPGMGREDAVRVAVEALIDAAEEDTATGGPDLRRGIFPIVATVTSEGYRTVDNDTLRAVVESVLDERRA